MYLHARHVRVTVGDSGLLLYLSHVFRALINSLVCVFSLVLYAQMRPSQPIGEGSAAVTLEGTFQF